MTAHVSYLGKLIVNVLSLRAFVLIIEDVLVVSGLLFLVRG
jgi:hypothetical protein